MLAKVSVVVPVFRVEKYLRDCLESVVGQSYRELDIILIDDGSDDGSGEICDAYAGKDNRIRVIHKSNGGLSSARNAGIEASEGDYIAFIDSDDIIHADFIKILADLCYSNKSDISGCRFVRFSGKIAQETVGCKSMTITGKEMNRRLYEDNAVQHAIICNKLYKRGLFNNIRFPEGRAHEDEFTVYRLYAAADKVSLTGDELYYYRIREDSITGEGFNPKRLDLLDAYTERIEYFIDNGEYRSAAKTARVYCYLIEGYLKEIKDKHMEEKYHDIAGRIAAEGKKMSLKLTVMRGAAFDDKISALMGMWIPGIKRIIKRSR